MKLYDLSQPLNQDCFFWPYYPPFEVKYIKRKAEHGVNAQYIQTSNHMGTHLDAPRHFVTNGMTIDEIPLEWLYGDGVIVDLRDEMGDLAAYTPEMIESRVEVREGDLLILHTGWHRFAQFGEEANEERYVHTHPGAHPDLVQWLIDKKIKIWGVDVISTDHPMNLPIGRFLGKGRLDSATGCARWRSVSSVDRRRSMSCSRRTTTRSPTTRSSRTNVSTSRTSVDRSMRPSYRTAG